MLSSKGKIIAILPAYNAEKTLVSFLGNLPKGIFDEIILVDDCSKDNTYKIAKEQKGIIVFKTPHNLGYGGNLKYCLSKAVERGADVIVEIHPDSEYSTDGIIPGIKLARNGSDMVVGNRFSYKSKLTGMIPAKIFVTKILSNIDNLILGTNISDLHQGFRIYTRKLLDGVPYKKDSDGYIFSFEIITQAIFYGFKISQVGVSARYFGDKKGASIKASIEYTLQTFGVICEFLLAKIGFYTKLFPARKYGNKKV